MVLINLLFGFAVLIEAYGEGEVAFLSKPPNIEFRGHEECDSSIVKDISSTCLGFTTYQTGEWSGLYVKNPFEFAEAVVAMSVSGVSSLGLTEGHKFPYLQDLPASDIWSTLETKITERCPYGENQILVKIDLEDKVESVEHSLNKGPLVLNRPNVTFLKEEEEDDSIFIKQVALMRSVVDKVEEKGVIEDGLPDLYWFSLTGLHPLVDIYGDDSNIAAEAKELLTCAIQDMKDTFEKLYKKKVLIFVLSSDSAHTRRFKRASDTELKADLHLAPVYDENYPVFFNIFLWFTIAFIMTLIATSMVTACMDPGRDSIIYRMTSTRMKKDN